jgi:hypothetical protein
MTNTTNPYQSTAQSSQKFSTLAIVGFVLAFVINIAGLVVSLIALSQIKRTGERGRGLAIAGVIISVLSLVIGIFTSIAFFNAAANMNTALGF